MAITTKVFKSGNSQAVRLPKKFRLTAKEVEIEKRGNEIILREKPVGMARAFHLLTELVNLEISEDREEKDRTSKAQGTLAWIQVTAGHGHLYLCPAGKIRAIFTPIRSQLQPGEAAISVVTFGELLFGAIKRGKMPQNVTMALS